MGYYIVAGLALGLLITFHEFGHYWVAKRMGMRVERFSLGFGPALTSWQRGETEFVLSAVPLGGYVKIAGMALEDDVDPTDQSNYVNKPAWQRALVIVAGPFANYVLAFIIGVGFLMTTHKQATTDWTRLGQISKGLPAEAAGMQEGDEVLSVDGTAVHNWKAMRTAIAGAAEHHPGQPFPVVVARKGGQTTLQVQPKPEAGGFVIGVVPAERDEVPLPFQGAVVQAVVNLGTQTQANAQLIGRLIWNHSAAGLSGPLGIIEVTADNAKRGLAELVATVWALSIAVGFMNLMPIPALDGGRFMFLLYEIVARRRLSQRVEEMIMTGGVIGVIGLLLIASYGDIMRHIHGG